MPIGEIKALLFADGLSVTAATAAPSSLGYVYTDAVTWNGSATTKAYDVSVADDNGNTISDARVMLWGLYRGTTRIVEGFEATIAATTVTITVGIPLPADTYRLIGR